MFRQPAGRGAAATARPSATVPALLAAALLLAGCFPDPIVGKWSAARGPVTMVLEFKADGTAQFDVPGMTQAMTAGGLPQPLVQQATERLRQMKITWKKQGKLYRLEGDLQGRSRPGGGYAKIEGERLVPCDASGKPEGVLAFTRQKA